MKSLKYTSNYFFLGYTFTLFALLVDSYKNSETVAKYLFIDSSTILGIFVLISIVIRLKSNFQIPRLLLQLNAKIVFPFSSLLAVGLSVWDLVTPPNYIYDRFAVNYQKLFYLALGSLIFIFIWKSNLWWKKNWGKFIFLSAPFIFLLFLVIRIWPYDFFLHMVLEDNFIENTQFFVILAASPIAFLTARLLWQKNKLLTLIYIILGLGTFFMAGEEVSWGQRILGFETPTNIAMHNYQNEFDIHNLDALAPLTWISYLLFDAIGTFSFLTLKLIPKKLKKYWLFLSPPWYVSSFFGLAFVYTLLSEPTTPTYIREWSEPAELAMYIGVLLFFCSSYILAKKQRKQKSNRTA